MSVQQKKSPSHKLTTDVTQIQDKEDQQKAWVINSIVGMIVVLAVGWTIVDFFIFSRKSVALAEFMVVVLGGCFLWWQRRSQNKVLVARVFTFVAIFSQFGVSLANIVGNELSLGASNIFWFFVIPPLVFFLAGSKSGLLVTILSCLWIVVFFFLTKFGILGKSVSYEYILDLLPAYLTVSTILFLYDKLKEDIQSDFQTALQRDRAVLNTIRDGIIVIDEEERIRIFNHAAEDILGWKSEDVLLRDLDAVFKTMDTDLFQKLPTRFLMKKGIKVATQNKGDIYVDLAISPLLLKSEPEEHEQGLMLTFHDVTEERELERMKLDFVAMAAHELRTPITSLNGYLSLLQEEAVPNMPSEHQEFVARALVSVQRLSALMENLLSITRIEEGESTIHKTPVVWEKLINDKIEEFKSQALHSGLLLEWVPPDKPLPKVMVDSLRIAEVLNNLLNNAIAYTREGKISVWCEYDQTKNRVITHVQDTGPGIPKESLPHLFEKFYRITGPLEEGSKGTGLGLYISKSIMKMHEGEIWVESELGKGSTFSFSLPCTESGGS